MTRDEERARDIKYMQELNVWMQTVQIEIAKTMIEVEKANKICCAIRDKYGVSNFIPLEKTELIGAKN